MLKCGLFSFHNSIPFKGNLNPLVIRLYENHGVIALDPNILTINELNGLLDIIHSLIFIENSEQLKGLALSLRELMEYDFIIFGLPEQNSLNQTQAVVDLNINYPQNWVDLYRKNEFWRIDPVVLASRDKCTPQRWSDIYQRTPPDKNFIELAHDFGLKDGWINLTKGSGLSWMIISVGGMNNKHKNSKKREEYIFKRLSPHFHIAMSTLMAKRETQKLQGLLTKREHEVLKWLSQGKSSWEISVILNVAEATINFHVKNINYKLNTVSRSHAVAVAAHKGLCA